METRQPSPASFSFFEVFCFFNDFLTIKNSPMLRCPLQTVRGWSGRRNTAGQLVVRAILRQTPIADYYFIASTS